MNMFQAWKVTGTRARGDGTETTLSTSFGRTEAVARAFFQKLQADRLKNDDDLVPWSDAELTFELVEGGAK